MIAVFNKKGITKEQLNSYGNLPRVGSQTFQIFAYFDGIDISNYGSAYIKLYRPDYNGSAYPILFMTKADLTFHSSSGITSNYLHNGQTYTGFIFDFAKIKDTKGTSSLSDDVIVTLLDTPGEWKAVITLVSTGEVSNVVGSISFNVSGVPTGDDEETEIGLDVVISTMADIVADKLDRESVYYVREISNFEAKAAAGQLPQTIFVEGSIVFDESNNSFYKINTVSENVSETGHVYCSNYTKLIDPIPYQHNLDIRSDRILVRFTLISSASYEYSQLGDNELDHSIATALGNLGYDGSGIYPSETLSKVLMANGYDSYNEKNIIAVYKYSNVILGFVLHDGTTSLLVMDGAGITVRDFIQPLR